MLSYNVRKGSPAVLIAEELRNTGADIICLQELDRGTRRSGNEDQLAVLTQHLGLKGTYVASYQDDGGTTGMAILSRFPIGGSSAVALENSRDIGCHATVQLPDGLVSVFSVHLSSTYKVGVGHLRETRAMRRRETSRLIALIEDIRGPVVLAGDFNSALDSDLIPRFTALLTDGTEAVKATFPAQAPMVKNDYIFLRGLESQAARLLPRGRSDHRGVLCRFRFVREMKGR